jgi:hypothetical protein
VLAAADVVWEGRRRIIGSDRPPGLSAPCQGLLMGGHARRSGT